MAAAETCIEPVSADPAVVLWDEVRAPDQQPGEDATSEKKGPISGPDKALH